MSDMSDLTLRDGRSLGTLTPTPEDDEGTWELLLSPEASKSLHDYVLVSTEASLGRTTDYWRTLGFEGAVYDASVSHVDAPPRAAPCGAGSALHH